MRGRLTREQQGEYNTMKTNLYNWLDENPTKTSVAKYGGNEEMRTEFNTLYPAYPIKNSAQFRKLMCQYRAARKIKAVYKPLKTIERLQAMTQKWNDKHEPNAHTEGTTQKVFYATLIPLDTQLLRSNT